MTLTELRYLVALANRGHFGRAAEDCHVSQPTLSTQIRKLEEYLGVGLIERNAKAFSLTSVGQDVVDKARKILVQVDTLLASTRKSHEPLTGPLNLGVIPSLAPYLLPRLLPLIKNHYPRLQLVVHEDLTEHLSERLRGYQIDAALLALPLDGGDFEDIPLFDEPFWFACPAKHPLAALKAVGRGIESPFAQVCCHADAAEIERRFQGRQRHAGHLDRIMWSAIASTLTAEPRFLALAEPTWIYRGDAAGSYEQLRRDLEIWFEGRQIGTTSST